MDTDAFASGAKKGSAIFRELRQGLANESKAMAALTLAESGKTMSAYERSLQQLEGLMARYRERYKDDQEALTQIAKTESAMRQRLHEEELTRQNDAVARDDGGSVSGGLMSALRVGGKIAFVAGAATALVGAMDGLADVFKKNGDSIDSAMKRLPFGLGALATVIDDLIDKITGDAEKKKIAEWYTQQGLVASDLRGSTKKEIEALEKLISRREMSPADLARDDVDNEYARYLDDYNRRKKSLNDIVPEAIGEDKWQRQADELNGYLTLIMKNRTSALSLIVDKPTDAEVKSMQLTADLQKRLDAEVLAGRLAGIADVDERRKASLDAERDAAFAAFMGTSEQQDILIDIYRTKWEALVEDIARKGEAETAKLNASLLDLADGTLKKYGIADDRIQSQVDAFRKRGATDTQADWFTAILSKSRKIDELSGMKVSSGIGEAGITDRWMSNIALNSNQKRDELLQKLLEEIKEVKLEIRNGNSSPVIDFQ